METRKQRWFIGIGVLFLLATNIVFVRLYLETPPGHQYTGAGLEAVADKFVYYSMIQQGAEGRLFMQNVHTSEPQLGLLFSPHWYLIGMTSRLLDMPIPLAYHLYRWIATVGFLLLLYSFIRKLFAHTGDQIGAFALVLFSSGLGWLYFIAHPEIADSSVHWLQHFNQTPIDLYVTEFSAFTNTLQSPLFILSHLLILAVWLLFLRERRSFKSSVALMCIVALFGAMHPYDLPLLIIVTTALALSEVFQQDVASIVIRLWPLVTGAALACIYHGISLIREPALSGWLSQNIAFSPSISNYLWGIGMTGPLALLGVWYLVRNRALDDQYWRLVLFWALAILLLIYEPTSINRRFANTLLIPLGLLSWYGLTHLLRAVKPFALRAAVGIFCAMLLSSGVLYQIAEQLFYQPTLSEKYNYYLDPYITDALTQLHNQLTYQDVLLPSTSFIGILSAAYAPTRLFVGHAHQTVQYELKKNEMDWFFAEPQTSVAFTNRRDFLIHNKITSIIIYKPSMTASYDWLDTLPGVQRVYDSVAVRIFKVRS